MDEIRTDVMHAAAKPPPPAEAGGGRPAATHEPPRYRVIPLDCEITAYAPDGDQPLF